MSKKEIKEKTEMCLTAIDELPAVKKINRKVEAVKAFLAENEGKGVEITGVSTAFAQTLRKHGIKAYKIGDKVYCE